MNPKSLICKVSVERRVIVPFLVLIILFSGTDLFGQIRTPKYSNEFLSIGVGARALGMGNTQVSLVNDVTAGYWNPAALPRIKNHAQLGFLHAEYFAGIANYDYGGFALQLDSVSALGISLIRFGIDDIPDTRNLFQSSAIPDYSQIRFFSASDYALLLSYGKILPNIPGLSVGGSVKIIYRHVGNFSSAWGFGIDASAMYSLNQWNFGLLLQDVTGTFNAWNHNQDAFREVYAQTGNEIPENNIELTLPKMKLGVSYPFHFWGENIGLLPSLDVEVTWDGPRNVLVKSDPVSLAPSAGMELDYKDIAFLRAGVTHFQQIKDFDGTTSWMYQPNFGVGVELESFSLDYALTDAGNQSDALYSHFFTFKAFFTHPESNRKL